MKLVICSFNGTHLICFNVENIVKWVELKLKILLKKIKKWNQIGILDCEYL